MRRRRWSGLCASGLVGLVLLGPGAPGAWGYNPIDPTQADRTVTLDGRSLTVEEVVAVARDGAKVAMDPAALARQNAAYELILEGARQNIPIYFFNRGAGSARETQLFEGDPLRPDNRAYLEASQLRAFRNGARSGIGPEVNDEEIVRAMMVVRLNIMLVGYNTGTPELVRYLAELINRRIAPVVRSKGSPGEGDLPQMSNVAGTMVGVGDAYLEGRRLGAGEALARAGLRPFKPFARDNGALISTNAYSAGQGALLLYDAERALDWSDLVFAMSLEGLNGNVSPFLPPSQDARPYPDQQRTAQRVLRFLRGSYLYGIEPAGSRIIQDPLSYRSFSQRNGAARKAWGDLERDLLIQMNSSDENPVAAPGTSPNTPELQSEYARRFYVDANGRQGYIFSNANWAPITWTNEIEAFSIALASAAAATVQRIERLTDTFFTVVAPGEVFSAAELANAAPRASGYNTSDLMAEIQTLANPVPAQGNAIVRSVEDTEAFGRQKVARARLVVEDLLRITGEELLSGSFWMELRERQRPERTFGEATSAALAAFREVVPFQSEDRPFVPAHELAYGFLLENPASRYASDAPSARRARRSSRAARERRAASRRVARAAARR